MLACISVDRSKSAAWTSVSTFIWPKSQPTQEKAESQCANHKDESTGTVLFDPSIGVNQGMARIDASINPGIGNAWRTPSKNHWWLKPSGQDRTAGSLPMLWDWKVCRFHYPSGIKNLIKNSLQGTRPVAPKSQYLLPLSLFLRVRRH